MCDSSSNEEEVQIHEPDPSSIPFDFLRSGKSELEGVLLTHNDGFKYHKGGYNRSGQKQFYVCSFKGSKNCPARAVVERMEVNNDEGETVLVNTLCKVSTPAHHTHAPDTPGVIADRILVKLKEAILADPITPTGNYSIFFVIFSIRNSFGISPFKQVKLNRFIFTSFSIYPC